MSTLKEIKKLSLGQQPHTLIAINGIAAAENLINEIEVEKLEAFNLGKKCGAESKAFCRGELRTPESSLRKFQTTLPWTIKYSQDYRSNPQPHKDFTHALVHTAKALGKLMSLADDMDHDRTTALQSGLAAAYSKYIADLVVCALRAANTFPGGKIDLQSEVEHRIKSKNEELILPPAPECQTSPPVLEPKLKRYVVLDHERRFLGAVKATTLYKAIDIVRNSFPDADTVEEAKPWI